MDIITAQVGKLQLSLVLNISALSWMTQTENRFKKLRLKLRFILEMNPVPALRPEGDSLSLLRFLVVPECIICTLLAFVRCCPSQSCFGLLQTVKPSPIIALFTQGWVGTDTCLFPESFWVNSLCASAL